LEFNVPFQHKHGYIRDEGFSANLRCRSQTCCTRLAENTGLKKVAKNHHLGTIAQLCWAISSQLRHVSTIGKTSVKQQCLPHMTSQYGELRPNSGCDLLASLGHPCKFQRVSRLGSVTARHSSSGRQPNFAALNRGATYIWQGGHQVQHWPAFLVCVYFVLKYISFDLRMCALAETSIIYIK